MLDAGTGADHLYIAGLEAASISETVRVRHDARPDVGDNLNIGMAMQAETGVGCYFVIVQHVKVANRLVRGVAEAADGKVMFGLQPAHISAGDLIE